MSTTNPFDLLGDDDTEDPNLFLAKKKEASTVTTGGPTKKAPHVVAPAKPAKLPTKPAPPSQAVREARNEGGRGEGGRGGSGRGGRGYGRGRGPGGANRDFSSNDSAVANQNGISTGFKDDRERSFDRRGGIGGPRGGFRGGHRGGFSNDEAAEGERPRRIYERHSGTGRSNDFKRDGAGRGNWGTPTDEIALGTDEPAAENETNVVVEKLAGEEENTDAGKEIPVTESEEKEPELEEKQMTLEEYEKVLEEKRKALVSLKSEERKVDVDKEFESMQLVSKKKNDDEVFIKLGTEKDKRKDAFEKDERAKKAVNINEFLKSGDGERYYRGGGGGGRGRGRSGRGRGGGNGGVGNEANNIPAPSIEDDRQFPSLGAK